jgi:molybdenum cofactor cytidylyltransferase
VPPPRTFAIVPACGHSTRMGRPKLALPLGDRTVIERVARALREGGVAEVVVVTGPHVPELASLAAAAGALVHALPATTPDMRATVEAGLAHVGGHFHPRADDWWLLAPADHPVLSAAVVRDLLAAAESSAHPVIVPVHGGRRGHPTLVRWHLAEAVRAIPAGRGLNWLFREHPALELATNDSAVLADLDTPEDYARLAAQLGVRL